MFLTPLKLGPNDVGKFLKGKSSFLTHEFGKRFVDGSHLESGHWRLSRKIVSVFQVNPCQDASLKSFDQVVRDSKISVPAEILRCLATCQAFPTNFKNLNTYKCRNFDAESYGIHIVFPIKTFLGTSYKKTLKSLISNIQNFSNNNSSFQVLKRRDLNALSNCISCCSV